MLRVRWCGSATHVEQRHSLVCPSALQLTAMAKLSFPSPASKLTPFTLWMTKCGHTESGCAGHTHHPWPTTPTCPRVLRGLQHMHHVWIQSS